MNYDIRDPYYPQTRQVLVPKRSLDTSASYSDASPYLGRTKKKGDKAATRSVAPSSALVIILGRRQMASIMCHNVPQPLWHGRESIVARVRHPPLYLCPLECSQKSLHTMPPCSFHFLLNWFFRSTKLRSHDGTGCVRVRSDTTVPLTNYLCEVPKRDNALVGTCRA